MWCVFRLVWESVKNNNCEYKKSCFFPSYFSARLSLSRSASPNPIQSR